MPKPRGGACFAQETLAPFGWTAMRASMTLRATSFPKTVSEALKVMPIAPRPNSTGVPSVWVATW